MRFSLRSILLVTAVAALMVAAVARPSLLTLALLFWLVLVSFGMSFSAVISQERPGFARGYLMFGALMFFSPLLLFLEWAPPWMAPTLATFVLIHGRLAPNEGVSENYGVLVAGGTAHFLWTILFGLVGGFIFTLMRKGQRRDAGST